MIRLLAGLFVAAFLLHWGPAWAKHHPVVLMGEASYYDCLEPGECGHIGRAAVTASGSHFDPDAHKCAVLEAGYGRLHLGDTIKIERIIAYRNHKPIIGGTSWCRVNDTGNEPGRLIDVTPKVKSDLGMGGIAQVRVTILEGRTIPTRRNTSRPGFALRQTQGAKEPQDL